jgi:hypothetical protein
VNVTLSNLNTGVLKIEWQNYLPTSMLIGGFVIPGATLRLTFVPNPGAKDCDNNLLWYQAIYSTIDNLYGFDPQPAIAEEKKEHSGTNPFSGTVGDNEMGDLTKPYDALKNRGIAPGAQSTLPMNGGLFSSTMFDAPNLPQFWPDGAVVTKSFGHTLQNGDAVLLTVTWQTTQTAGDPSQTTIDGSVAW